MAASTWTWLGNISVVNVSTNWSLTSGPGNAKNRPQSGDTGIFSGAGVAPQFLDTQLSGSITLDLKGAGTVQFLNDTGFSNTTSIDPSIIINATGTATSILTAGTVINAGKIEVSGAGSHLGITITPDGTLAGLFENDGQIIVDAGASLSINAGAGQTFAGFGTVSLVGGSALINANFAGFSGHDNFSISQSGSLELQQSSTSAQADIMFNGLGTLKLDQPGNFAGTIDGFVPGDTIDLGVLNVTTVVYDNSGNVSYIGSGGTAVFSAHSNSGLFGGNGGGTFALSGTGGVAGNVIVTEGGGGDTILTAAGPRTWMWTNGVSASAESANWTLIAGPPGGFGGPGAGDTAIIDGGTVLGGGQFNLTANTIELGGTAGLAAILTDGGGGGGGGGNTPTSATFPSLDNSSTITSAVPGNTTAETSLLATSGTFVNEGSIVADGPAGSSFTIAVGTSTANGTLQPGYFINYNDIEVNARNSLTITVAANSELFNDGVIQANGGTLVINAAPGAIVGGYAPTGGVLVITGGGMVETNASYPSTITPSGATVGGIIPIYAFADTTSGNTLKIDNIGSFGGAILGFGAGDTIDIGTSLVVGKIAYSSTTGVLALEDSGGTILASLLLTSGNFQNGTSTVAGGVAGSFTVGTGTDGNTVLTTSVQNDYFNNNSGSWQSAGLWSNGVPGALDTALIGIGGNSPFTLTTGASPVTVGALTVASENSTLQITSNTTTAPYVSYVFGGTIDVTSGNTLTAAILRMEGGSVEIDPAAVLNLTGRQNPAGVSANNGTLAFVNGNTAALRLTGGSLLVNGGTINAAPGVAGGGGNFFIGYNGSGLPGSVTVQNSGATAGVVTDLDAIVSSDPTSFGVLTLNGNAHWTDTLDPTDTLTTRGFMLVGFNNQSPNAGTLVAAPIAGTATLVVENGATLTEQSYAMVGDTFDSDGSVLVANALWNIGTGATGGFLDIGRLSTGTVLVDGGGTLALGHGGTFLNNGTSFTGSGINVGQSISGGGTLTVRNGGIVNDGAGMIVGASGTGLVQILNGGTINLTGTNGVTAGNLPGSVGTVLISGQFNGPASVLNIGATGKGFAVGGGGQGTLDIESGGTFQLNGTGGIGVGTTAGAVGRVIVNGSGALLNEGSTAAGMGIGQSGNGTLEVTNGGSVVLGGTAPATGISIGQTAGASGRVLVSGPNSSLSVTGSFSGFSAGQAGSGTLDVQSGGKVSITGNGLGIGTSAGGDGTVSVTGIGSAITLTGVNGAITVGTPGTGNLSISASGSVAASAGVFIATGGNPASKGTVTVNGGTLTDGGVLTVGSSGGGTINVLGGGLVQVNGTAGISVGIAAGASGVVIVNGGTLADVAGLKVGGINASGSVQVGGGGSLSSGSGTTFANINATGTGSAAVTVSAGTWNSAGSIIVGDTGTGLLDINSNGQVNAFQNSVTVGNQSTGNGTLSLESGGTLFAGSVSAADGHDSTSRGTIAVGANSLLQAGNFSDNGGGTVDVNGTDARLVSTSGISVGSTAGATGILTVGSGGTVSANGASLIVGGGNGANGTVTVGNSGSLNAAAGISLAGGTGSSGKLVVSGGTVTETGVFSIGNGSGGTVAVNAGGTIIANAGTGIASVGVAGGTMSLLSIDNGGVSVNGMNLNVGGLNTKGMVTVGAAGTLSNNTAATAVFISATGTGTATATVSGAGAVWKSNGQFVVGDTGGGSLDINTNGVVNAATTTVTLGQQSGGSGTVSLESGGSLRASTLLLDGAPGFDATGTVAVAGGAVLVDTLIENAGGVISLSGGAISVNGAATIGQGGTGASVTQTGGNLTTGSVTVARNAGSSGTIAVSGGIFAASGLLTVGGLGSGAVSISAGGSLTAANGIQINGSGASGKGVLRVNGGAVTETGQVSLGTGGSALLIVEAGGSFISNGTSNSVNQISIGSLTGGMAALIVDNGLVNLGNGVLSIGAGGNGSMLVENGGTVTSTHTAGGPAVDINATGGAQASAQVVGAGSVWDLTSAGSQFIVGDSGNGSLSVSAGGVVDAGANAVGIGNVNGGAGSVSVTSGGTFIASAQSTPAIILGLGAGATGTMTVSGAGSKVIATGQLDLGSNGSGSLAISNQGTVQSGNGSQGIVLGQAAGGSGAVSVSGTKSLLTNAGQFVVGDNSLGSLSISAGGTVITSPGTNAGLTGLVIGNTAGAAGSSVNVSGAGSNLQITGLLDVGVNGSGSLQLSGGASVTAGALDAGNSSSSVGQISVTGAGTNLIVLGDAIVADDGTGVLSVLDGASFSATNLTIGSQGNSSGALVVSGAGSVINLTGSLNIGTSLGVGDLTIGPGGAVHAAVVNLQGQVVLEGGNLDPTVTIINQGQTAGGNGTIQAGFIVDEGVVQAGGTKPSQRLLIVDGTVVGGGTLTVNGTVQPSSAVGVLQINASGTLELTGPVLNAATTTFTDNLPQPGTYTINNSVVDITFADAKGVLLLDNIAGFGGTITSFLGGDQFVIKGGALSNLAVSNGNTLTFSDSGVNAGLGGIDSIIFGSAISAAGFSIANGNTVVVACFAAGTRIETENGPVAVEDLAVGDLIVTNDRRAEPIMWTGSRAIDCERHPKPETVWPVRVSAGAFGPGVPSSDLFLSPDHAVFVNGALVPVKLLINGTSIAQVKRDRVVYFHVELPRHDVILAEGLPVESYLDTGDRANFGGDATRLFPDFTARLAPDTARVWETRGAARLVMAGPELVAAKRAVVEPFMVRNPLRRSA